MTDAGKRSVRAIAVWAVVMAVVCGGMLIARPAGADDALDIAVPFVADREGFRADAYCDDAGNATIGYGQLLAHDCDDLAQYEAQSESDARSWLQGRVIQVLADLRHHAVAELAPHEEAALASLAYNIGAAALDGSKLLLLINSGEPRGEIIGEWVTWDKEHRGGRLVRSRGLSERRALEVLLYMGGGGECVP